MTDCDYYLTSHGTRLAYRKSVGSNPGVVFLGGFMSDMEGTKATTLEAHCRQNGQAFLRFDYQGHGKSKGAFADGTIGLWVQDTLAMIDALTTEPQIIVGSSMGGWLGLLVAKTRPSRVAAFIGIAAAPDFTVRMWDHELSEDQKTTITTQGLVRIPTDYGDEPYTITKALIDDGWRNRIIDAPLKLAIPIRLLQGTADRDVPWQTALTIADVVSGGDIEVILVPDGDHSLSRPKDLIRLKRVVDDITAQLR